MKNRHKYYKNITHIAILLLIIVSLFGPIVKSPTTNASARIITKNGNQLNLYGKPYTFTGTNAYSLATYWGDNLGCGDMMSDQELDDFFAGLRPNSVVRFWAFQDLALQFSTGQRTWQGIDRVFAAAEKYNQFLLPTLSNHWNACDGGNTVKDDSWYNGGYLTPYSTDGNTNRIAFWDYMQQVVTRYKNSPALGMWELTNEPEMSCGQAGALKTYFDTVGGKLKSIDSSHLLVAGVIGGNQCSIADTDYQTVMSSSVIDVTTYHDYADETSAMPFAGSPSGLSARITQSRTNLNKPIVVEETGIIAGTDPGCTETIAQRNTLLLNKMTAQFNAGVSGFMPWNYMDDASTCSYSFWNTDPILTLLRTFVLPFDPVADLPVVTSSTSNQSSSTNTPAVVPTVSTVTPSDATTQAANVIHTDPVVTTDTTNTLKKTTVVAKVSDANASTKQLMFWYGVAAIGLTVVGIGAFIFTQIKSRFFKKPKVTNVV